jgi:DNA-binding response OmpR family regulator
MAYTLAPAAKTSKKTALTATELSVLGFLQGRLGRVVTRVEIQDALWPGQENLTPATVDKNISAIRRKLGGRVSLQTFYGAGYILIR